MPSSKSSCGSLELRTLSAAKIMVCASLLSSSGGTAGRTEPCGGVRGCAPRVSLGNIMELIRKLIDVFLHLDQHLNDVIAQYGTWTYLILFLIVFCETGLVVTPILPGDSLLFAAGAFAALGSLNVFWLFLLLSIAAVAGHTTN